jgi:hypothetical protein
VNQSTYNNIPGHAASNTVDTAYWRIEANSSINLEHDLPFVFTPTDCVFTRTYSMSVKKKDTYGNYAGTCVVTTPEATDTANCAAVTALNTSAACDAVVKAVDNSSSACTYANGYPASTIATPSWLSFNGDKIRMESPVEATSFVEAYYEVTVKGNKLYNDQTIPEPEFKIELYVYPNACSKVVINGPASLTGQTSSNAYSADTSLAIETLTSSISTNFVQFTKTSVGVDCGLIHYKLTASSGSKIVNGSQIPN